MEREWSGFMRKSPARSRERAIKALTQQQVAALFRAIPKDNTRDRLMFAFCYRYGMRTQELCDLPIEAVDRTRGEVTIEGLKNGLKRTYPLFRDLKSLVRKWKPTGSTYFSGRQGPLSRKRIWAIFKQYARAAGIPEGYGVHSLRHSAAVHLLDADGTIEEARDLLRHKHIMTTEIYATLSTNRRNGYLRRLEDSPKVVKVG
jgi:site-specific recombinase XerD